MKVADHYHKWAEWSVKPHYAMRHSPSLVTLLLLALLLGCRSPSSSSEREIRGGTQAAKRTSSPTTSNAPAPAYDSDDGH